MWRIASRLHNAPDAGRRSPKLKTAVQFRRASREFFTKFASLWPGALADPYDLLAPFSLPESEIVAIKKAATAIGQLYNRVYPLLCNLPDEALRQMGLSETSLNLARVHLSKPQECAIARVDLVRKDEGYKLLDFNADMPGLLLETFSISSKVCEEYGVADPNRDADRMLAATWERSIRATLDRIGKADGQRALVAFTSHGKHDKDRAMAVYLTKLLDLPEAIGKEYVPVEQLRATSNHLHDGAGNVIDVLCRLYPLDLLQRKILAASAHDRLTDLIQKRAIAVINSPAAYLLEGKAVQAVIWGLYESGSHFSPEERTLVGKHFLPTYLDPLPGGNRFVVKPAYGREGDSVKIVQPGRKSVWSNRTSTYSNRLMVYQEYCPLPRSKLMTEFGPRNLSILISCFLLDGTPCGIGARAGSKVTDNSAWFLPLSSADDAKVVREGATEKPLAPVVE